MRICRLVVAVTLSYFCLIAGNTFAADHYISKEIEYKTDDGWTISGTLRLPIGADKDNLFAAMVMLHDEGHDRLDSGDNESELALRLPIESGIATLAIDIRGRQKSMGEHQPVGDELHSFSTKLTENMYLDVKGALEFLATYPGIDHLRLGILAPQFSAEPAVRAMRETLVVQTRALVLLGGHNLSKESKEYLAGIDTPIYVGASLLDKPVLMDMTEVYVNSKNPDSHMFAPVAAERGMNLLMHSNLDRPAQTDIEVTNLMVWLENQVRNLGRVKAVSFKTRDGWEIHGNLRYPDDMGKSEHKIPGIVQISGARSNRYSMLHYEEELSRRGYAVLSVELRGRGNSMQGQSYDSPEVFDVRENLLDSPYELDTIGAVDFLAAQPGIDAERLAIVGEARGSRSALLAAVGDKRIRTLILVSVYDPDPKMELAAKSLDIPVLFVDGEVNWAAPGTLHIYGMTRNAQLMMFPGMGHSHHIPYFHPEVSGYLGDYMERTMPPATPRKQYEEKPLM